MVNAMTFSLCPANEIKLLAVLSLFAVAFLTGPATGLAGSWSRGWVQKLQGVAVGCAVGPCGNATAPRHRHSAEDQTPA